jgi:3-methylcrotonyl-CoA carboxylase alpha subunit
MVLRDDAGQEYRIPQTPDDGIIVDDVPFTVRAAPDGSLLVTGTKNFLAWAVVSGETCWVFIGGEVFTFDVEQAQTGRRRRSTHHDSLAAPMPATVRKVAVARGDTVRRGDVLIVLEAMKMELPVRAIEDGTVAAINCREGDMVQAGQKLVDVS